MPIQTRYVPTKWFEAATPGQGTCVLYEPMATWLKDNIKHCGINCTTHAVDDSIMSDDVMIMMANTPQRTRDILHGTPLTAFELPIDQPSCDVLMQDLTTIPGVYYFCFDDAMMNDVKRRSPLTKLIEAPATDTPHTMYLTFYTFYEVVKRLKEEGIKYVSKDFTPSDPDIMSAYRRSICTLPRWKREMYPYNEPYGYTIDVYRDQSLCDAVTDACVTYPWIPEAATGYTTMYQLITREELEHEIAPLPPEPSPDEYRFSPEVEAALEKMFAELEEISKQYVESQK